MADEATLSGEQLKAALCARHPYYDAMMCSEIEWPLMRAVTGGFQHDDVKKRFLPMGPFENQYETRIKLSHFSGKTGTIASSFAGAVFMREPEVDFMPTSEEKPVDPKATAAKPPPDLGPEEKALSDWADDVDGQGSSITELLETHADEAITMGLVGFYVTKPKTSPEQEQAIAEYKSKGLANKRGQLPADIVKQLGLDKPARVRKFGPENITNWEHDDEGRLDWVTLTHEITRQKTPWEPRENLCQWIVITRTTTYVYEASIEMPARTVTSAGTATVAEAASVQPLVAETTTANPTQCLRFPLDVGQVGQPKLVDTVNHNLGIVPFVMYYGGGKRVAPLCVESLMSGTKRLDLTGFNFWSWFTMGFYVHNSPLLEIVLQKGRKIDDVQRDVSRALQLLAENRDSGNGRESADYKSTPSDSFDASLKTLERLDLDAYRQAGHEPVGLFEQGGSTAESGKAKQFRHRNTEARSLSRISKDAGAAHYDLLEIGARYLLGAPMSIDEHAFAGGVRYAQQFDLADVSELIEYYLKVGPKIRSLKWHHGMLIRIAMLSRGEVSKQEEREIKAQIEAQTMDDLFPPLNVGPDGKPLAPGEKLAPGIVPALDSKGGGVDTPAAKAKAAA